MSRSELETYMLEQFHGDERLGRVQSGDCDKGLAARVGDQADCDLELDDSTNQPVSAHVVDDGGGLAVSFEYVVLSGLSP